MSQAEKSGDDKAEHGCISSMPQAESKHQVRDLEDGKVAMQRVVGQIVDQNLGIEDHLKFLKETLQEYLNNQIY